MRHQNRFFVARSVNRGVSARMRCEKLSILFTHYGDPWIRGSEQVLMDLVTSLDKTRFTPIVWCNGGPVAERLREALITVRETDFTGFSGYHDPRFNLPRYLSFVTEGVRLVRQHKVALVHANGATPHQWLFPVGLCTRLPVVAHLHANYLRRERFSCLLHQATRIVGVSQSVVQPFLEDGVPAGRCAVIHNGIEFDRLSSGQDSGLRRRLGIGEDAVVIAAVGSLIERKGVDLLLQALARLCNGNIHLVIAGDGPQKEALSALAGALNLTSQVHFLGYCADISPVYAAADIAALGSRSEAFGLALAEAGYFSLPVVSHALPGIAEVVSDGKTGILVPVEDIEALTRALRRLAVNAEERIRMGAAARKRVCALFSVRRMVTDFERLYLELGGPKPASIPRTGLRPYFRLLAPG
jgi:glycosyltransferase involved in cell wall biosynthesis